MSSKLKIAQKLCKLLKESVSLRNLNPGFGFMYFEDKKLMPTADGSMQSKIFNHEESLCGHAIWTPGWRSNSPSDYRRATIGGIIMIDEFSFILSAAHIFYPDDSDSEENADSISSPIASEASNQCRLKPPEACNTTLRPYNHIFDCLLNKEIVDVEINVWCRRGSLFP